MDREALGKRGAASRRRQANAVQPVAHEVQSHSLHRRAFSTDEGEAMVLEQELIRNTQNGD